MEIISIEQLMKDKLAECDTWLAGNDEAVAELARARELYLKAEEKVAEYTEKNIVDVVAYRDDLKARLGIVDEVKEEVVLVDEKAVAEPVVAERVIPTQVEEELATDEIVEMPIIAR